MPAVADVLLHVESVKVSAREEVAERKWQQVLEYLRLHYNPDLSSSAGPKISDHTRAAIRAAGGLAYLGDCLPEEKQWARKRFIDAYMRWEELERDYALLPEGEFKASLKAVAEAKSVPALPAPGEFVQ